MGTTTYTERVGLGRRVLEWFQEHAAELSKKGLNMKYWIEALENAIEAAVNADTVQESLKAQLRASTAFLNEADGAMYALTSGAIDAAAGAYGKSSQEGKQIARMRSELHRKPKEETTQDLPIEEVPPS